MNTLASKFGINYVVETIHLPMKVIWGDRLLGLGDIVLPGALVAFSLKLDCLWFKARNGCLSYFKSGMIGYAIGLFLCHACCFSLQNSSTRSIVSSTFYSTPYFDTWMVKKGIEAFMAWKYA